MKPASTLLLALMASTGLAQVSISNGDFELYDDCPTVHGQIGQATDWFIAVISPDYFNCGFLSLPNYPSATQAFSGAGWAGFLCSNVSPTSSEAIGQHLASPLLPDHDYRLTLAAKIPNSGSYTSNCGGIGVYGFEDGLQQSPIYTHASTLPGAMLIGESDPVQHADWQLKEILISPPDTVNHILLTINSIPSCQQYIFVDSLVLVEVDFTGVAEAAVGSSIQVFSVPGDGAVQVRSDAALKRVMVMDALGRLVHEAEASGTAHAVRLPNGLYWVTCFSHNARITKAVVVQ